MTYGVHPHSASRYDDALEKEIEQAMSHPRTVAWVLYAERAVPGAHWRRPHNKYPFRRESADSTSSRTCQNKRCRRRSLLVSSRRPWSTRSRSSSTLATLKRYFACLLQSSSRTDARFADDQHRHNEQDTLRLLKEHVPTEWKIHMPCFGESPEMAAELLALYPNVYFGFTGRRPSLLLELNALVLTLVLMLIMD